MFALLLLGFLSGVAFMLGITLLVVLKLTNIYQGTHLPNPVRIEQFSPSVIPKILSQFYSSTRTRTDAQPEKAVVGVNLLLMFLFQELKNTEKLRRWFQEKVEVELLEIKSHAALQLVLRDLKLDSFDLGNSLPLVKVIKVITEPEVDAQEQLETVDLILDLSYSGEVTVSLEALVSFDRTLMFSCKVLSLVGQCRLRFTRQPYTNWSISFLSEPVISLDIKSNINGRNIPQIIIPLLSNQIKRLIRKKHTLPAYKMRIKPFFNGAMYTEEKTQDLGPCAKQTLEVTVASTSRLVLDEANSFGIFALITLGPKKYVPKLPYTEHSLTVTLSGLPSQRINGLSLKKTNHRLIKKDVIIVDKVKAGSPAAVTGLVKGDVITRVEDKPLSLISTAYVRLLLNESNSESVSVTVSRYKQRLSSSNSVELHSSHSESSVVRVNDAESLTGSTQIDRSSSYPDNQPHGGVPQDREKRKSGAGSAEREMTLLTSSITSAALRESANKYVTATVACSADVEFAERFSVAVESEHVYLNVALFSLNKSSVLSSGDQQRPSNDSLIGYASLSLHDILGHCSAIPRANSQLTVSLTPPPDLKYRPSLAGAREMDVSKCYGDVTLRFYAPEYISPHGNPNVNGEHDTVEDSDFEDIDIISPATNAAAFNIPSHTTSDTASTGTPSSSQHSFREQAFNQAVNCNFCLKKIWFKKAMRCDDCHMITHKKCVTLCQLSTNCSQHPIVQPAGSEESLTSQHSADHPGRAARASNYVLGKLRKRKNRIKAEVNKISLRGGQSLRATGSTAGAESSSDEGTTSDNNAADSASGFQIIDSLDSSSEDDAAFETQFMKEYLSKQGQSAQVEDSDELVITAAKKMGKELFASLDIEERKNKLESMVEKLQLEIQMVSAVRDDHHKTLKSCATAPQRQLISSRIKKADEKMQALAVLLVHYYSGLQHCADQIEEQNIKELECKNIPQDMVELPNGSSNSGNSESADDTDQDSSNLDQTNTNTDT